MNRETIIEAMARAMCVEGGFDPDERMPNDGPRWGYYVPGVTAALAAIEAAGVRLVPVEATEEMVSAYYDEMPTPYHIDMRDTGEARQAFEHVLAASPYAPKETNNGT